MQMESLTIRIPVDMKKRIQKEAFNRSTFDNNVSASEVARELLEKSFKLIEEKKEVKQTENS